MSLSRAYKQFLHHLLVQRDNKLYPLRYGNGDFIYKEADRHLAGRGPLTSEEEQQKKSIDDKVEREGLHALTLIGAVLLLVTVSVIGNTLFGAKTALGILVLGLLFLSRPVAITVLLMGLFILI